MNSPAVRGINPPWDTMEAVCDVCGSDFGTGSVPVTCLRVRMDHCSAFYGVVCRTSRPCGSFGPRIVSGGRRTGR